MDELNDNNVNTSSEANDSNENADNNNKKQRVEVDPNYIYLKFVDQKAQVTHLKVRQTSKIERAFRNYCQHHHLQYGSVRFLLNGNFICDSFTPATLNLQSGDEIEVYTQVHGGAALAPLVL